MQMQVVAAFPPSDAEPLRTSAPFGSTGRSIGIELKRSYFEQACLNLAGAYAQLFVDRGNEMSAKTAADLAEGKPRKVKLPVCPVCNAVGKRPGDHAATASMRFSCDGGSRHPHVRIKMEFRTFVEEV